jgi:hypothetical protein
VRTGGREIGKHLQSTKSAGGNEDEREVDAVEGGQAIIKSPTRNRVWWSQEKKTEKNTYKGAQKQEDKRESEEERADTRKGFATEEP